MVNDTHRHYDEELDKATAVASQSHLSHDAFSAMVAQMVTQCGALLRQQLEHKAKHQPLLYDHQRIQRIMREFEVGSTDIQDAIAARVMSRLTHHVQQEVLRVLNDALNDAAHSLEDPLWDQDNAWRHTGWVQKPDSDGREPPSDSQTQEPAAQEMEDPAPQAQPEPPAFAQTQQIADQLADTQPSERREHPASPTGNVYEGTVKLRVDATDSFRQIIQFVESLRQKSDFRLLKLVGGFEEGVDIWIGLRAPLALKEVLLAMEGVSSVESPSWLDHNAAEPLINVKLANNPSN